MPRNDNYEDQELIEGLARLRRNRANWLALRPTNEVCAARRTMMLKYIDGLEAQVLARLDR